MDESSIVGPLDPMEVPRYAGPSTFARLPRLEDVSGPVDVAVVGVPFDAGTTYRPGARFGPGHIRQASRLLRPYHAALRTYPFQVQQVVDAGDVGCTPFDVVSAISQIEQGLDELLDRCGTALVLGGDHTIALPSLRAIHRRHGRVALLHFDAHLDTWDTYFEAQYTHGTPFRRASEEGLFDAERSMHVGIRGSIYDASDLDEDAEMGFRVVHCMDIETIGVSGVIDRIVERAGDAAIYVSVDIDVLDPAHAPGTGTPEAGGLTSRELLGILRGLRDHDLVGADIVEVSPAYDHAELTGIAASNLAYELLGLFAHRRRGGADE